MIETDIFSYYAFGYNYYLLKYCCEDVSVLGEGDSLLSKIDTFLGKLQELNLQVTERAAYELILIREQAAELPKDSKVDAKLAQRVTKAVEKLDATLDAELQLRSAFIVTPKRLPLDSLLRSPRDLFAEQVFEQLPPLCRFDFTEAGRCIAFSLPTAAAFHITRGTEGVLRFYYCTIVKRNRVKRLMWGEMVDDLRKRRDAPPKPLMDNLDNIRVNFRNPTQHPEARYDIDEAQDLLSLSVDVINRMIRDLMNRGDLVKKDEIPF